MLKIMLLNSSSYINQKDLYILFKGEVKFTQCMPAPQNKQQKKAIADAKAAAVKAKIAAAKPDEQKQVKTQDKKH